MAYFSSTSSLYFQPQRDPETSITPSIDTPGNVDLEHPTGSRCPWCDPGCSTCERRLPYIESQQIGHMDDFELTRPLTTMEQRFNMVLQQPFHHTASQTSTMANPPQAHATVPNLGSFPRAIYLNVNTEEVLTAIGFSLISKLTCGAFTPYPQLTIYNVTDNAQHTALAQQYFDFQYSEGYLNLSNAWLTLEGGLIAARVPDDISLIGFEHYSIMRTVFRSYLDTAPWVTTLFEQSDYSRQIIMRLKTLCQQVDGSPDMIKAAMLEMCQRHLRWRYSEAVNDSTVRHFGLSCWLGAQDWVLNILQTLSDEVHDHAVPMQS